MGLAQPLGTEEVVRTHCITLGNLSAECNLGPLASPGWQRLSSFGLPQGSKPGALLIS